MISYIGGKSRMAKWINEYIPKSETYAEVFGGAFWVYINGNISSKNIVYNDYNKYMANLFQCFRNQEKFLEYLERYKSQDKKLFQRFQSCLKTFDTNLFELGSYDVGAQYAYLATQVFSGSKILESNFIDLKGKYGSKYDSLINKLKKEKIKEKLNKITSVENLDYTDLMLKYDSKDTFFYVDPPYWKTEKYYSNHNFDTEDHYTLIEHLKRTKAKWALSYYDFPELELMLPKHEYTWVERVFNKAAGAKKGKKQSKGVELLIMNYKI